ncbi:MAG: cupin domain-containing protein [Alphaproteobacteria bacterium]|nr:cupin domain-containing protein [Alphaproteobacteria bacterium]
MKLLRIYADADGESHIEEVEIDLNKDGAEGRQSPQWKVTGVFFSEIPPGGSADWHPAPRRQLAVVLKGEAELEVSDGTTRHIRPGHLFLVEDTTGKGHLNKWLDDIVHEFVFMPLAD